MTLDQAVVERTLNEFCVTHDAETAMARIYIWLAVERREGAVNALRNAAKAWRTGRRSLVSTWLNGRADKVEIGGQL